MFKTYSDIVQRSPCPGEVLNTFKAWIDNMVVTGSLSLAALLMSIKNLRKLYWKILESFCGINVDDNYLFHVSLCSSSKEGQY